jgi:hypothetical protein
MEWKTFGRKGKLASARREISRILRLTHNTAVGVSGCPPEQEDHKTDDFNVQAYREADRRMHEIETQQALMIMLSGHERWKAGRPT